MKKKNITLVFVAIVFSIIVGMIIGKSLLKYKEGEPDVVGSFSMNRDENLTVVANRKNISDKEAFARLLLKMYKENSFHSIKFSTDHGYATSLDMTVYSWKEDIENGKSIMQIEFRPIEYGKDYDIVHNLDGVLEEFDRILGLPLLRAVHLNDSMMPFDSRKDRHAVIGGGEIGLEALLNVMRHPKLKDLPFYLETPLDDAGHKDEIARLKEYLGETRSEHI